MSKGQQTINGVKYYGCATQKEAAEIAGTSSSSKELITINEVLDSKYLDIVEDPVVNYLDKQACAYVDIKKKEDTQIDQEKPAEINNIRVGVVQIENETTISYSDKVYTKRNSLTHGEGTETSVWNQNATLSVRVSFTVINQNKVPITVTINEFSGSISGQYPSSNISKNLLYQYNIGSNWTEYTKVPTGNSIEIPVNTTLYFNFKVDYTYTGYNTFKGLECTIAGSCQVTESQNQINTSTSKIGLPLKKKSGDLQLINPSVNLYPFQSTISANTNLPQIDQVASKCKNGVMDVYLTGGDKQYAYTTCSKADNTFFGFLVPVYFTDFDYTFTDYPTTITLYNHIESVVVASDSKLNGQGDYFPIMNNDGASDFIKNTASHISTEIYYGQINFSEFGTYYNSSNTPHMVIGLSFTDNIFPQSTSIDTKILSLVCEFTTYDQSQSGTKHTITFNFWVKALNAVPIPEEPTIEENAIYYYLPSGATQIVDPTNSSDSNTKKLKSTFGTTNILLSEVSKGSDGGWLYKVTKKDGSSFLSIGETPNSPYSDNWDMYDYPPTSDILQNGSTVSGTTNNGYITVFYNSDITYVKLPNTVQTIGAGCFAHCSKLKQINTPTSLQKLEYGAFYKCINLQTLDFSGSQLNKIGHWCFTDDYNITQIHLPDTWLLIYSRAFQNCSKLETVHTNFSQSDSLGQLETGLQHVYTLAFDGCTSLTSIDLGRMSSVGKHAFRNCYSLKDISINNTKEINGRIYSFAFIGCTNVEKITSRGHNPIMGMGNIWYAKSINPKTCNLHIETSYQSEYQHAPQWGDFFTYNNVIFIES